MLVTLAATKDRLGITTVTQTGVAISAATPAVVTFLVAHGNTTGQAIRFTAGTLPTGLLLNTTYYVSLNGNTTTTVRLSSTLTNAQAGIDLATSGLAGTNITYERVGTYDQFLTDQINLIGSAINNYCGRIFELTSYIQTFYTEDFQTMALSSRDLFSYQYPIDTVASIKEKTPDGVGGFSETTLLSYEYRMNKTIGKLNRTSTDGYVQTWFLNSPIIEVTYDAGYSTIPLEIQEVVFNLVGERYSKKIAGVDIGFGNDVQRLSIPGVMSIDFDYTLQQNERKSKFGMIIGNYSNVLDAFSSERVLIGAINTEYAE